MKKLITVKTVQEYVERKEKTIFIDDDTLVTPSAKDEARSRGIKLSFVAETCAEGTTECKACGDKTLPSEGENSCQITADREILVETIMEALAENGILDKI